MALALDEGLWWQSASLHSCCIPRWVGLPRVVAFSTFCEFVRSPSYLWLVVMIGMVFRAREQFR